MTTVVITKQDRHSTLKVFKSDNETYEVRTASKDVLAKAVIRDSNDTYELVDIWVAEHMRNFGMGTTLLAHIANDLDKPIKLNVDESNIPMMQVVSKLNSKLL